MPASNTATDSESIAMPMTTNAHSNGSRSSPKPSKPAPSDNKHPNEPLPTTALGPGHYDNVGSPMRERPDSKPQTFRREERREERRDTEDKSRLRDQGDSTRTYPSTDHPTPQPPRSDNHAGPANPSAQTQSILIPESDSSSENSFELYTDKDMAMLEERQQEQANAVARPQPAKADYTAAAGSSASRQGSLPPNPRPSSNAQSPPPPPPLPPHSTRTGPGSSHRSETRDPQNSAISRFGISHIQKFLPSTSASDPSRTKAQEDHQRALAENQRFRDDLRRADNEIRHLRQANREIEQERVRYRDNATALQNELKNVQRELEDYRALSEIRGKELMGAQVFLTKADLLSASELSQKVSDLNDENFQAAAWFSESLIHMQRQWKSEEESNVAYQVACTAIGEPAARILITTASEPEPNPFIVQLVTQIYLAKFCATKIERWYEASQETNNFLSTMYGEIRRKEEQAVSGRWRAITHAHTRSSPDNWTRDFTSNLKHIMGIASWEVSSPDKRGAFEQQLKPIFKAILDIRIALGEQFTSADIEVFCPPAGVAFDSQCMEDALDDGRRKQKDSGGGGGGNGGRGSAGIVIGTSGIGLRGVRNDTDTKNIVLPAKVILQSTLQELLQPPSTSSKSRKSKSTTHTQHAE